MGSGIVFPVKDHTNEKQVGADIEPSFGWEVVEHLDTI